ncbi:uncharacterized protein LOC111612759 [Centruroides sculpturatus]|uniref:uncharacterized protein LOC111612759 n=1 Tax=Centruroides sculpturatus TaxID=218467 RepID=UPI000C6EB5A4|nr:uncharacterized protein LOC111612759 [Centruroides sculpturatus]
MYNQNGILEQINKDEFIEKCRISIAIFKGNIKEKCRHVVLSVASNIRNILIQHRYISLSWVNVKLDDYVPVIRCFQCAGFNHMAKDCREKTYCSHCTKNHRYNECNDKQNTPCCINCIKHNRDQPMTKKVPTNHNAYDKTCPILQKLRAQKIKQMDYGIYGILQTNKYCTSLQNSSSGTLFQGTNIKVLQINTEKCKAASSLLINTVTEKKIDIVVLQEPYTLDGGIIRFSNWKVFPPKGLYNKPKTGILSPQRSKHGFLPSSKQREYNYSTEFHE